MNGTNATSHGRIPSNRIIHQDCLSGMRSLPDECIDMVVTSPPYWRLRDYGSGTQSVWGGDPSCNHNWVTERSEKPVDQGSDDDSQPRVCLHCRAWYGQLGLEADVRTYIAHLIDIFDEVFRVLKPTGSCWVNIGDSYFSAKGSCRNPGGNPGSIESGRKGKRVYPLHRGNRSDNPLIKPKSMTLIPFHFCIAMQAHGWMLRNTIIWHKHSCMPSSVKDRFTVDFEYLFFFVKQRHYYFEQQFEPFRSISSGSHPIGGTKYPGAVPNRTYSGNAYIRPEGLESRGRNKRAVWTINPKPFPDAHFAVFPDTLIEAPILAGCPEKVCVQCGTPFLARSGRRNLTATHKKGNPRKQPNFPEMEESHSEQDTGTSEKQHIILSCDCDAGYEPGIVLDPFIGSGTTALMALKLNSRFIGFEIKKEYCEMAERRIVDRLPSLSGDIPNLSNHSIHSTQIPSKTIQNASSVREVAQS